MSPFLGSEQDIALWLSGESPWISWCPWEGPIVFLKEGEERLEPVSISLSTKSLGVWSPVSSSLTYFCHETMTLGSDT